jgi:hypothetical protein
MTVGQWGVAIKLNLRGDTDVLVLVYQVIHRMRRVVLHLEDSDHALLDVAVLVETDFAP